MTPAVVVAVDAAAIGKVTEKPDPELTISLGTVTLINPEASGVGAETVVTVMPVVGPAEVVVGPAAVIVVEVFDVVVGAVEVLPAVEVEPEVVVVVFEPGDATLVVGGVGVDVVVAPPP